MSIANGAVALMTEVAKAGIVGNESCTQHPRQFIHDSASSLCGMRKNLYQEAFSQWRANFWL